MSAPTDVVQVISETIVAALNPATQIIGITGRTGDNVIPWHSLETAVLPVLLYLIVSVREIGGLAYTWQADLQLSAFAPQQADANALVQVAQQLLIAPTFAALASPVDAFTVNRIRKTLPFDATSESVRADLLLTMQITLPSL